MRPFLLLFCSAFLFTACEATLPEAAEMTLQTRSAVEVLPADAAVVGMVNVREMMANGGHGPISANLSEIDDIEFQRFLDATGFDPATDLEQVYVAVTQPGSALTEASMVVYADVDAARFATAIEAEGGDEVQQRTYRNTTVYFSDDGPQFALVNDEMIALASSAAALDAMLDRLAGEGIALGSNQALMDLIALAPYPDGAWLAVNDLPSPDFTNAQAQDQLGDTMAQLSRMVDDGVFSVEFDDAEINVVMIAAPRAGINTSDVADVVKGAIALAKAEVREDDTMRKTLDAANVRTRDNRVEIHFSLPADQWQHFSGRR